MELTIEVSNIFFEDWSDDIDLWRWQRIGESP